MCRVSRVTVLYCVCIQKYKRQKYTRQKSEDTWVTVTIKYHDVNLFLYMYPLFVFKTYSQLSYTLEFGVEGTIINSTQM